MFEAIGLAFGAVAVWAALDARKRKNRKISIADLGKGLKVLKLGTKVPTGLNETYLGKPKIF